MVYRHGALYHDEYGWDETFERLVLGIVNDYVAAEGDKGQAGWVAELDGERLQVARTSLRDPGDGARRVECGDGPLWIVAAAPL